MDAVDGPQLTTNAAGIALIKGFESCSLTPYQDEGGLWTNGWGHTNGVPIDRPITQEEADANFLVDLAETEGILNRLLPAPQLSANQFSALVSFCFNVGFGRADLPGKAGRDGFYMLKNGQNSTMYKCILSNEFGLAALEFPKWDHIGRGVSSGLLRRRQAEQALFLQES